jgi:hypothetical protein
VATTYGVRLNFRDTSAASCKGLVHGSCWPDAEEPGSKHDLEGKREPLVKWLLLALAMGMAKRTLLGVKAHPARTFSSR